jgi:hypothetical protein
MVNPLRSVGSAIASLRQHGCRFVIGDSLRYAQEKGKFYAIDADGRECKLAIVRQERCGTEPDADENNSTQLATRMMHSGYCKHPYIKKMGSKIQPEKPAMGLHNRR